MICNFDEEAKRTDSQSVVTTLKGRHGIFIKKTMEVKIWEYKIVREPLDQSELNHYGSFGWELVSHTCAYVPENSYDKIVQQYTFKRLKK